jgi:hypothetical protein
MEDEKEVINVRIIKDEPENSFVELLKNPFVIAAGSLFVSKLVNRWTDKAFEKIDAAKQAKLDAEKVATTIETTATEA